MKGYFFFLLMGSFLISCGHTAQVVDVIPPCDSLTIASLHVNETRKINVWTPPEYKTGADSFAVMYMADGGIKEDFPHIANTMAELIKAKTIPPMILVGIENTQRRKDLTGPTQVEKDKEVAPVVGGSEKFRAFIQYELFPEINKRYRTTAKKGILGESLSGLFVVETLFLKPELFDYYIAFDPSLWWNNHYLVTHAKEYLATLPATNIRFWFAASSATDINVYSNNLANLLKTESPKNLIWTYSDEPTEKHNTIFRATKVKALQWTLGAH